jgi:predicted O-methyltransferase YrrM
MANPLTSAPAIPRRVRNRDILLMVLRGLVRRALKDPRSVRRQLAKSLWIELKRFSAPFVSDVSLAELVGDDSLFVQGGVPRTSSLVLVDLARVLECRTIFEFGTYRGDTSWLLAHHNGAARVFTLDLPGPEAIGSAKLELTDPEYFERWERGETFKGTPEASRITPLVGDSATFDFTPFAGQMDLVFIDASHSYSYVKCDTEAALTMLAPCGTIVWDDYTYYPGVYAYLNELSPRLTRPIEHILGTRLAIYRSNEGRRVDRAQLGQTPIALGQR